MKQTNKHTHTQTQTNIGMVQNLTFKDMDTGKFLTEDQVEQHEDGYFVNKQTQKKGNDYF